jgi:uncharacterized damage-inducible protein DinB
MFTNQPGPTMTQTSGASTSASYSSSTTAKQRFLRAYERDHATTLKVLRAFPGEKSEFRPHERSNTALNLGWTFVIEELLMLKALRGERILSSGFPSAPETWAGVLDAFDKAHDEIIAELHDPKNQDLEGTADFYVAPKQTGDIPLPDFLDFMLHDQIHHRGQLSVYVRMTGGKVPSIYGPSADEPW